MDKLKEYWKNKGVELPEKAEDIDFYNQPFNISLLLLLFIHSIVIFQYLHFIFLNHFPYPHHTRTQTYQQPLPLDPFRRVKVSTQ